jgi:hypothetical protein
LIFAYVNQITNYTLSATAYNDIYTIDNIKDTKLDKIFKGTDSDVNQRIVIDAGAAIAPQMIAILGHNFTTETISIQANDTGAWGAVDVDYEFTSISDIMYYLYTGVARRYWSILIENCVIPGTPPEVGYVYMGDYVTFTNPESETPSDIDDNSIVEKSETNTLYSTKGNMLKQNFNLTFTLITEAEFTSLKTLFQTVGKALPFIIIWDITKEYVVLPNLYCTFTTGIKIGTIMGYTLTNISFTVEECR